MIVEVQKPQDVPFSHTDFQHNMLTTLPRLCYTQLSSKPSTRFATRPNICKAKPGRQEGY